MFKALVSLTCVVVLAVVGFLGLGVYHRVTLEKAEAERVAKTPEMRKQAAGEAMSKGDMGPALALLREYITLAQKDDFKGIFVGSTYRDFYLRGTADQRLKLDALVPEIEKLEDAKRYIGETSEMVKFLEKNDSNRVRN